MLAAAAPVLEENEKVSLIFLVLPRVALNVLEDTDRVGEGLRKMPLRDHYIQYLIRGLHKENNRADEKRKITEQMRPSPPSSTQAVEEVNEGSGKRVSRHREESMFASIQSISRKFSS